MHTPHVNFGQLTNLAAASLGTQVIQVSDDFFASKDKLIKDEESEKDNRGRVIIDMDPVIFKQVVKYLDYDRAWMPDDASKDALAEVIIEWDLDIGLSEPFILTNPTIKAMQEVLNSNRNFGVCEN